jgi:PDZ domain-containing protein
MPRRTATLIASSLMLIALLVAGLLLPVPYAEMSPGPTVNTLGTHGGKPVLSVKGHRTYATSGHLNMTTVEVSSANYSMDLIEAVTGWLARDRKVVEHDTLYPDGQTEGQADQENAEEFSQSQDSAKVAALRQLHIKVGSRVVVSAVVEGGAAQGRLHAGDVIEAVDGKAVKAPGDVAGFITKHKPGQRVVFTVIPKKESGAKHPVSRKITVTTRQSDDTGPKRAVVGIEAGTEHILPFTVTIRLADVGGPSAGLMFALGIIDKLTPGSLTGGAFVAGTGTISDSGKVGAIGGIDMKTIGARRKGARYFLTPASNCAEAAAHPPAGLRLVKVHTISDALAALKDIRTGHVSALPSCSKG